MAAAYSDVVLIICRNKTALMFQCAVSECTNSGYTIIISQQRLENMPLRVHGMPQPDVGALKNLKILYVEIILY